MIQPPWLSSDKEVKVLEWALKTALALMGAQPRAFSLIDGTCASMEPIRLKFAVQNGSDSISEALDSFVDQITSDGITFTSSADVIELAGVKLSPFPSSETRILMFIYLDPLQPPIQCIGRILSWVQTPNVTEREYNIKALFDDITPEDCERVRDYIKVRESGAEDRRQKIRRRGDLFVTEVERVLELLVDMCEGKRVDFGRQFARLIGVKNTLGRRADEKMRGEAICTFIERLAFHLDRLTGAETGLQKVQVRKVTEKDNETVGKDKILVGWAEASPQVGKSYCLYLQGGGVFRSARITKVLDNHFKTVNSLYEIQKI